MKGILLIKNAYDIMSVSKRDDLHGKHKNPQSSNLWGFFYAYLLSRFLSSHLQMRWQITPVPTERINEMISCMETPPFRCRTGCDNGTYYIIQNIILILKF